MTSTVPFEAHRGRLLGLAYRMMGSRSDAEDIVQDAWLRWTQAATEIKSDEAFLTTIVTRLCLDWSSPVYAEISIETGKSSTGARSRTTVGWRQDTPGLRSAIPIRRGEPAKELP